jgi:multidrug efflux pump subunit AcrA (membrane-fusion protein)
MSKWLLLLVVAGSATGFASWRARSTVPVPDTAHPLSRLSEAQEVHGTGYVEPVSEVRKLMMRTGGVIKKCYYDVGDRVQKDAVIVELEDATQRAEVELAGRHLATIQAEAAHVNAGTNPYKVKVTEQTIDRLQEKLRHNKVEAERNRVMLATRSATHQDYEAAETQRRQTEVELKEQQAELEHLKHYVTPENRAWQESRISQARASLQLAEERLRETKLLAPLDGTVLKILKREGEGVGLLNPEPVILFGDTSRMRVRAEIDERYVRHLAVGQSALIHGRNLFGQTYRGKIAYLEHIMGDKTVFTQASSERKDLEVLQVLIDVEPGFRCPSGMRVDVTIQESTTER